MVLITWASVKPETDKNFEVKKRFTETCIMWFYFLKKQLYLSLMYSKLIQVSLKAMDQIIFIK